MATRAQLMEAVAYARRNGWELIDGNTLRRTWTVPTPEICRSKGPGDTFGKWACDTYDRHLFVTIVGSSVIVGDARAPWVGRSDTRVSMARAIAILTAEYDGRGEPLT